MTENSIAAEGSELADDGGTVADGDSGEDAWAERMQTALVGTSAFRIVCTLALRHLFTLMVPATVMLTPIGLLAAAMLPIVAADHLLVVNGRIELVGDASMPLFAWLGGLLLAGVPAAAVAGAATMLIAAGRALGRPVHWRSALQAAVRRARGLTALAFIQLALLALTLAVGVALIVFLNPWVGIAATVVIGLVLMPTLLAMPAFVLEGLGPFGALSRGYRLVATMRFTSPILLAISVIILPGLASRGLGWVADRLPYPVDISMSSVTAVLLPALQAAVLAVIFLNRIAEQWHGVSRPELRAIVDRLPEQDGPRTRIAAVLAVLVLPGLLTGAFAAVNPLGWVEVSDHVAGLSPVDETGDDSDDHGPSVSSLDLTSLYVSPGPKLAMYMQAFDGDPPRMLTCPDLTCADLDIFYAGDNMTRRFAATAALPDGRTVVASWDWDKAKRNHQLRLVACDQASCSAPGKPIAWWSRDDGQFSWSRLAVAARPGGVVLVQADRPDDGKTLTFTSCRDLACADPVRHTPVRLRRDIKGTTDKHSLKLAFGPDGRPVAAVRDGDTGAVSLVTCETADCASATVTTPGPPVPADEVAEARMRGLSLAVRRDGRPVIAYGDPIAGAIKLLDCQDRACSGAESATLAGDRYEDPPGLVLSGDQVLVATFVDKHLVVYSCRGTACRATRIAKARHSPLKLAMSLDQTGRPVIAWIDARASLREPEWSLRVTSPLI